MLKTSARLLRLLALLQSRPEWPGPELAGRLGVTTRTVRTDVQRLRELGYPVEATVGRLGGYRLGAGAALPPLLLDDEEAVAVAVGLRAAAAGGIEGIEESAMRTLAKLDQVLPSRLRHRVGALHDAMLSLPLVEPAVPPAVLTAVVEAIRMRQQLRFDYEDTEALSSRRSVEPHRLVHTRGRWYVVAWDPSRDDWRLFRADRVRPRVPHGSRFAPREPPAGGIAALVERRLGTAMWRYRAKVLVHAPAAAVSARVPSVVVVEAVDDDSCVAHVGSDDPLALAMWLGMLDADFEVSGSPELADALRLMGARYLRAAGSG